MKEKQVYVVIQKQFDVTWCAGIFDSLNEAIGDRFNALSEKLEPNRGRITPLVELDNRDNGYTFSLETDNEEDNIKIYIFSGYYDIAKWVGTGEEE